MYCLQLHALRPEQAVRYYNAVLVKIAESEAAAKARLVGEIEAAAAVELEKKAGLKAIAAGQASGQAAAGGGGAAGGGAGRAEQKAGLKHKAQTAVTAAAKARKALEVRAANCDDFVLLARTALLAFAEPSLGAAGALPDAVQRLGTALLDDLELGPAQRPDASDRLGLEDADTSMRNSAALSLLPTLLVEAALGKDSGRRVQRPGDAPTAAAGQAGQLAEVLAEALAKLAELILELPLRARERRHAAFARLAALHTAIKSSAALDQAGRAAGTKLLKAGLAELDWLRAEAADMATLGRERLAPDPPTRTGLQDERKRRSST
eukprot:SAG22_NODE_85_length_21510_cov_6.472187_7_plen_322_part_00